MKKMKKICSYIIVAMLSFMMYVSMVEAKSTSKEIVYSNELGLTLTENEFNYVTKYIDADSLDVFSEKEMNYVMSDVEKNISEPEVTYVKTTYKEVNGKQQIVNEEYISEQEMRDTLNMNNVKLSEVSTFALEDREDTVTTNMKKIKMEMYSVEASVKKVQLICTWLSIPKTKSFDVVAFRPGSASASVDTSDTDNVVGYQYHDDDKIKYKYTSNNIKYTDSGLGLSTNIVNDVSKTLKVKFSASFLTSAPTFKVYGTYQHATSDVTLNKSQKYSISSSGMGKVLKFKSGVASKYDNTPGLVVTGSLDDYLS